MDRTSAFVQSQLLTDNGRESHRFDLTQILSACVPSGSLHNVREDSERWNVPQGDVIHITQTLGLYVLEVLPQAPELLSARRRMYDTSD
jgi:hypothetical protein